MTHPTEPTSSRARGFTLVELLVSIALVVLLLTGVNQVFKMSADAIGAGQKVTTMTRDNRGAQSVMQDDFNGMPADTPVFMIWAEEVVMTDGSTRRYSHVRFFRQGVHHRHTGNDGQFTTPTQALDAYVGYGVSVPQEVTLAWNDPAVLPVIHRNAILLRDRIFFPTSSTENRYVSAGLGLPQWNTPIAYNAQAAFATSQTTPSQPGTVQSVRETLTSSRLDLAETSIDEFRAELNQRRDTVATPPINGRPDTPGQDGNWWQRLVGGPNLFQLEPFAVRTRPNKPLDSESVAKTGSLFVGDVSNFIVEFAGDYVTQNMDSADAARYGQVTVNEPDGVTDFFVYDEDGTSGNPPIRKTRWYGLPRDVDGKNGILWRVENQTIPEFADDVVPVKDVMARGGAYPPPPGQPTSPPVYVAPFERSFPSSTGQPLGYQRPSNYTTGNGGNVATPYVCLWANGGQYGAKPFLLPRMLRFLIKVEDPSKRLPDGQWWEYTINL